MTEGGIAQWKVKEGDSFAPGDVLLEIVRISRLSPRSEIKPLIRILIPSCACALFH